MTAYLIKRARRHDKTRHDTREIRGDSIRMNENTEGDKVMRGRFQIVFDSYRSNEESLDRKGKEDKGVRGKSRQGMIPFKTEQ